MYRTKDQVAQEFIAEGRRQAISPRGIVICIATGLVESNLTVYANAKVPGSLSLPHDAVGSDGMSVGPLQQQVIMGNGWWWGPVDVCQDPTGSARLFYQRLKNRDYNNGDAGAHAQAIQQSAYPDRYAERMGEAQRIYDRLAGGSDAVPEVTTERMLNYNHSITPQEQYWDCAPAATQVILSGRGQTVDENTLIRECGTTVDGTPDVNNVRPVLERRTGVPWVTRHSDGDPMSPAMKDQLWADVKRSIATGYGMLVNWWAPPSNYPRGVKGSVSPAYRGGMVMHYVAVMGIDETERAVWIADSGFSPFGYWLAFDQLATLIPPKGWAVVSETVPVPDSPKDFLMDDTLYQSFYVDPVTGQRSQFKASAVDFLRLVDAKVEQQRKDIDYLTKLVEALAVKAGA